MVATYTKNLPTVEGKRPIVPSEGLVVVLTGSTGALGSHLLASLLADERIRKVYTLDRAEHVQERQQLAFEHRLLPMDLLNLGKLRALTVNAGRADLGLDAATLAEVGSDSSCASSCVLTQRVNTDKEQCHPRHPQCLESRLQSLAIFIPEQHCKHSSSD